MYTVSARPIRATQLRLINPQVVAGPLPSQQLSMVLLEDQASQHYSTDETGIKKPSTLAKELWTDHSYEFVDRP